MSGKASGTHWQSLKADGLATAPKRRLRSVLKRLDVADWPRLARHWRFWSHEYQDPPAGDWALWLLLAGRGAGKTRAGAEWVNGEVAAGAARHVGLIGDTLHDVRAVMVEGRSGLLRPIDPGLRPDYEASLRRLRWPNGAVGQIFSAEDAEQLRGPEFDLVWADEFGKWRRPDAVFDMVQMCLRVGPRPRMLVTTTPRVTPALKRLVDDPSTVTTRAASHANRAHLSPQFLVEMEKRYGGARLGRQEILGEMLTDDDTALWQRAWIEAARTSSAPPLVRIVVAVDPPVTGGPRADACGIVVAGRGADGDIYVLADRTRENVSPARWAAAVHEAAQAFDADAIVAETNQGGELVTELLRHAGGTQRRVLAAHARLSKAARAAPVALLYEQGRVHHVGTLPRLEDQMCLFGGVEAGGGSPDRVDALVWAVSALSPAQMMPPRIRVA